MNYASSVFHLFLHVVLPTLTFDSLGKLFSIALFLKAILVFFSPKSRIVCSCLLPSLKPDFKAFCYSPFHESNISIFVSKNANHPSSAFHLFLLVAIPHIPLAFVADVSPLPRNLYRAAFAILAMFFSLFS